MTEQEAQALINAGAGIDNAAATETAAASGVMVELQLEQNTAAMEWIVIPETLAWAITTVYPETEPHYTDEAKMKLAARIADVAQKYGWEGIGSSPEVMLAIAAIGFAAPAYLAHRTRKLEQEEEKAKREGGTDGGRE